LDQFLKDRFKCQVLPTNNTIFFFINLRSENILINTKTKKIKVIDFGSAQLIDANNSNSRVNLHHSHHHYRRASSQKASHADFSKCKSQSLTQNLSISKPFRTFRGTNLYKPPEYILHHCFYPRSSTVWSFGIIIYDMVCGNFPFDKDSDILTHQDRDIEFSRKHLSDNLKDLVKKCLSFYVCDRINIEKILNHSWFKND
jgi:serine/threonine protein kinase